jgi:SAM-dependent methyltransferase
MKLPDLSRLHDLRMATTAAGYELDAMRDRFAALRSRHEDGTAPQAVAAHQLFQTPEPIAARLAALLPAFSGAARVLEPSAGLGRILRALRDVPGIAETVAVEVDRELCGCLFRMDLPGVRIMQRDFLTVTPAETGLFDAVAMNPPFTMRADIAHIRHALRFLKPGGILAGICMAGRQREEALWDIAETWEELPAGTFREAGTNVPSILFSIRA